MMCTSGSGHRGSWIELTTDAARTCTGMDWVMVVSRSCRKKPVSVNEDSASAGKGDCSVVICGTRVDKLLVMIVRTSKGILSCLVRRIEAEEPVRAERRARNSRLSGTCRLMAFLAVADWMV